MDISLTPDRISRVSEVPLTVRTCTVCQKKDKHPTLLEMPSLAPPHDLIRQQKCNACGSLFCDPPDVLDYDRSGHGYHDFWRVYVEAMVGVWETIWPILVARQSGSLLDVGCGFGFSLDFWNQMEKGEAVGVELGDYGQLGKEKLGLTIYKELLQECLPLKEKCFDVVYASEVIEHVPNPQEFCRALAEHVSDDGVLILTTPSAEFVKEAENSATLWAALFPGFHGFLLSVEAFTKMLRDAGFQYVEVRQFNERQIAWASHRPLTIDVNAAHYHPLYLDFLRRRLSDTSLDSSIWQGYAYRFLRDLVNTGKLEEAQRVAMALTKSMVSTYGESVLDPEAAIQKLKNAQTMGDVHKTGPFFLPGFYFYLGRLSQLVKRDGVKARRFYAGAAETIRICAGIDILHFLEPISLFWPAMMSRMQMSFELSDNAQSVKDLVFLIENGKGLSKENAFSEASIVDLEVTLPSAIEALVSLHLLADADALFRMYSRLLGKEYGDTTLTDEVALEAALQKPDARLPLNPLILLLLAGVLEAAQQGGRAPESASLKTAERFGTLHAGHPRFGERMKESAIKARTLLTHRIPSSTFTYKIVLS